MLLTIALVFSLVYLVSSFSLFATHSVCHRHKAIAREKLGKLNSEKLRKVCASAGIKWRNAHGKNRHLKKEEMIQLLVCLGA